MDLCDFKVSLVYIVSSKTAKELHSKTLFQKKKQASKQINKQKKTETKTKPLPTKMSYRLAYSLSYGCILLIEGPSFQITLFVSSWHITIQHNIALF